MAIRALVIINVFCCCFSVKDVCQFYGNRNCSQGCSLKKGSNETFCFCNTGYKLMSDEQTCLGKFDHLCFLIFYSLPINHFPNLDPILNYGICM